MCVVTAVSFPATTNGCGDHTVVLIGMCLMVCSLFWFSCAVCGSRVLFSVDEEQFNEEKAYLLRQIEELEEK
jgi:hypothetical protein